MSEKGNVSNETVADKETSSLFETIFSMFISERPELPDVNENPSDKAQRIVNEVFAKFKNLIMQGRSLSDEQQILEILSEYPNFNKNAISINSGTMQPLSEIIRQNLAPPHEIINSKYSEHPCSNMLYLAATYGFTKLQSV